MQSLQDTKYGTKVWVSLCSARMSSHTLQPLRPICRRRPCVAPAQDTRSRNNCRLRRSLRQLTKAATATDCVTAQQAESEQADYLDDQHRPPLHLELAEYSNRRPGYDASDAASFNIDQDEVRPFAAVVESSTAYTQPAGPRTEEHESTISEVSVYASA